MRDLLIDRASSDSVSGVSLQDIEVVRGELLDSAITVTAIAAVFAVASSWVRCLDVGFQNVMVFQLAAAMAIAAVAIFRRRLSFEVQALALLGLLFCIGAYELVSWGLVGMGISFLMTCSILAAIFVSFRYVVWVAMACLVVISSTWIGVRNGSIAFDFDVAKYAVASSSWLAALVGAGIFTAIVVLTLRRFHDFMTNSIGQLNVRTVELQEINSRLEAEVASRVRAEATLREGKEKYRSLFEGSGDAIVMTALDGRILEVNPATLGVSGYTSEELTKMNAGQLYVDLANREKFLAIMNRYGAVRDFDVRLRSKDGQERECLVTSSFWKSDKGDPLGFQTILRDVTAQKRAERELQRAYDQLEERVAERTAALTQANAKLQQEISEREQAEEALRQSEEKYRILAENAEDVIFTLDMNLTYTYVSPSVKTLRGFEPSEVIGRSVAETLSPESLAAASRSLAEALRLDRQEGPGPMPPTRIELQMKRKDGSSVWTEVKCAFIRDDGGRPTGILGVTRDISDRKQAEEALRKSERQLRLIADNSPAYIAYVGMDDLRYYFVNRRFEESFGRPRDEIIGKHIREVIGESNYQFALKYIEEVKAGNPASYVNVFNLEEGKRWVRINYVPDFGEDGKVQAIVVLSYDITDHKRAEEDLQVKTHELGERVKELNCLYGISKIAEKRDLVLDETLQGVVNLIPPSWQYPEITCARIILDGQQFKTKNFVQSRLVAGQSAEIIAHDKIIGSVEVGYLEEMPEIDEGPFLKDERSLINEIAERVGIIIERSRAEEKIREQNAFLTNILESLSYPFCVVNVNDYTIEMANSAAEAARVSSGLTCYCATHRREEPCNGPEHPCPLEQVKMTKRPVRVEHVHSSGDGSAKYIDVHAYPVLDNDGNVKQMIEYLVDITEQKKAEEALRTAYHSLNQIIEFLPDPTIVIDQRGRVTAWNRAMAEWTNIGAEDMVGKGDFEYAVPFYGRRRPVMVDLVLNYDTEVASHYRSLRREGDSLVSETYLSDFHGRGPTWLWNVAAPLYDEEGHVVGAIEAIRDITDRKQVEEALRESQEQFALFMDVLPHGVFIKDESSVVIYVNQYVKDLFNGERWIGKDAYDAFPSHPELAEAMTTDDRNALDAGQIRREESMPDKNGNTRVFETTKFRIPRADKPPLLGGIGLDITDRVRAREALRRSEERYKALYKEAKETEELNRSLLDSTLDAIVTYDLEGQVTYVNNGFTKAFGWTKEELTGGVPYVPESEQKVTMRNVMRVIRDGHALKDFETVRLTKKGDLVDVSISASRFNDHEGNATGMLVILRDISERKQAEKELADAFDTAKQLRDEAQAANRAKSAFVANMSHEIRTPMNAVIGMTDLALRMDLAPKLRDYLTKIRTSSQSLLRIINDILDFSKIEAGKLDLESVRFDLHDVIFNMTDLYHFAIQQVTCK